ncbi:uncharacterized protein LOC112052165 isoform X2 [Bicyclus anynana]|uniref:Uncharacterized protein LOC112052165 isoform X2 n=1 Tax=Bicyclus anynana TaxID=110368 RepID=A0ABM3LL52_BICAN|nr:uncharacterized protein LOC112052165 isoform X2 [Bicyclus anynana]
MTDFEIADTTRLSRPSLAQVKAVVEFIQKHPSIAQKGLRHGLSQEKVHKQWVELSNIVNSIRGAVKSTKGWIKFWSDKRRNTIVKEKQIRTGKIVAKLTSLEQKILNIAKSRRKKSVPPQLCNGDDNSDVLEGDDAELQVDAYKTEADERHLNMMEQMALAVDRLAGTFETIDTSAFDVRNAVISIDYSIKKCFATSSTQHRQNNLFS